MDVVALHIHHCRYLSCAVNLIIAYVHVEFLTMARWCSP